MSACPDFEPLLYWVQEREAIRIKKERGDPWPWTKDAILRDWSFCCPRREHDRVTLWIKQHIRRPYHNHPALWWMLACGRWINLPDTLQEIIDTPGAWPTDAHFDPKNVGRVLESRAARGEQMVGGAYKIPAGGRNWRGWSKARFVSEIALGRPWADRERWERWFFGDDQPTVRGTVERFMRYEGWGPLLSFQVATDQRYTDLLRAAPDRDTWASAGPGTIRGLNRLHGRDVDAEISQDQALTELREVYGVLRRELPGIKLDLPDAANCLCETDKLMRARSGGGLKRRYKPPPLRQLRLYG